MPRIVMSLVCGVLLALGASSVLAQGQLNHPHRLRTYEVGEEVSLEGQSYLVICSSVIRGVPAKQYALIQIYPMEHGRAKRKDKLPQMIRGPHNPNTCFPQPPLTYVEEAVVQQSLSGHAPQGTPEPPPPKPPQ